MFLRFYLGTAYQIIRNSLHDRRTAAQTDSFDLVKMMNVTSNVNQPEASETNKIPEIVTSLSYTGNTQIHSLGRH